MLDENCPVVTPTPEGSDMSYIEQSDTPQESLALVQHDSSVESQQESSPIVEETGGENSSTEEADTDSYSGSILELSDENHSELVSSVPVFPLQNPINSTSQDNLPVGQKAQVNPEPTSKPNYGDIKNRSNSSVFLRLKIY